MKKYMEVRRKSKISAFVLSFLFVVTSLTTTYAATLGVAGVNDQLYQGVEGKTGEISDAVELEEVYVPASQDNDYSKIQYGETNISPVAPFLNANELTSFNWTVEPGTRYCSGTFKVTSGQHITISASATPNTQTFWIGIMDPNNNVRYVEGSASLSHTFDISKSGKYRVFVQNRGTSNISAGGNYYFY